MPIKLSLIRTVSTQVFANFYWEGFFHFLAVSNGKFDSYLVYDMTGQPSQFTWRLLI